MVCMGELSFDLVKIQKDLEYSLISAFFVKDSLIGVSLKEGYRNFFNFGKRYRWYYNFYFVI